MSEPQRPNGEPPATASTALDRPDPGSRAVAVLLAVAALVAAVITARASLLAGDAGSAWQQSVGDEQRRGAMALEQIRYTYTSEGDLAFLIATAQVRAEEQRAEAARQPDDVAAALIAEAQVHEGVVDATVSASEVASDPRYALEGGGHDLQLRLADERRTLEADLTVDPLLAEARGDLASDGAIRLLCTTLLVGVAFFFGALAQAVRRWRAPLLSLGGVALLAGAGLAAALELVR